MGLSLTEYTLCIGQATTAKFSAVRGNLAEYRMWVGYRGLSLSYTNRRTLPPLQRSGYYWRYSRTVHLPQRHRILVTGSLQNIL